MLQLALIEQVMILLLNIIKALKSLGPLFYFCKASPFLYSSQVSHILITIRQILLGIVKKSL